MRKYFFIVFITLWFGILPVSSHTTDKCAGTLEGLYNIYKSVCIHAVFSKQNAFMCSRLIESIRRVEYGCYDQQPQRPNYIPKR